MTISNILGFIGVAFLLIAYFLNLKNIVAKDAIIYIVLNIVGAGLACASALFIKSIPFVILETAWVLVSVIELFKIKTFKSKQ